MGNKPISWPDTEKYDAVVLDLGLPKVDGLTLLRGGGSRASSHRC